MIEDDMDIKKKVEEVLQETTYGESRAAKMDIDDLLKYVTMFLAYYILLKLVLLQTAICIPRRWHPFRMTL